MLLTFQKTIYFGSKAVVQRFALQVIQASDLVPQARQKQSLITKPGENPENNWLFLLDIYI